MSPPTAAASPLSKPRSARKSSLYRTGNRSYPRTNRADSLRLTFAAPADPTRRAILARLASGEADVSSLVKPFGLSQPTISKHLAVLERAGLVRRGRDAQRRPRTLLAAPLQ